jgi:hypothetical protein
MNKKNIIIIILLSVAIAIPTLSAVSAASTTTVTDEGSQVKQEPMEESTTDVDSGFLKQFNLKLNKPSVDAVVTKDDAIKAASTSFPLSYSAKSIKAEYQLLTATDMKSFSEKALVKNNKLKEGLNGTPVYIITFKGVSFPSAGGGKGQHVTFTENNVVVDATSGEVLFSFSYK